MEAIFRYINLLVSTGPLRINDARRIAATARKLNPGNGRFKNLEQELERTSSSKFSRLFRPNQMNLRPHFNRNDSMLLHRLQCFHYSSW